jgi:phospholipase C
LWKRTVVFVTWDDWGGWSDHVKPPNVEQWDSRKAQRPPDAFPQFNGEQFRYGSRVPCLVVSPYARKGFISKKQRSHISLLKFCQSLFGIPSVNPRLDTADDMADCFDPTQAPLAPPHLPPATTLGAGPVRRPPPGGGARPPHK